MQDNLDFLQFTKRYWDQYFPGHEYDAIARRKGAPTSAPAPAAAPRVSSSAGARKPTTAMAPTRPRNVGAASGGGLGPTTAKLKEENASLQEAITGLERERDFYFSKLRDIELLIQQATEAEPELEKDENSILKHIQSILYSTEVGDSAIPDHSTMLTRSCRKDSRYRLNRKANTQAMRLRHSDQRS